MRMTTSKTKGEYKMSRGEVWKKYVEAQKKAICIEAEMDILYAAYTDKKFKFDRAEEERDALFEQYINMSK